MLLIRTLIALAVSLAGGATQAKEFTSSDIYPADCPTAQAVAHMDRQIRERTHGRHSINVLVHYDQVSENYLIGELRNGTFDMARDNLAVLNNIVPSTIVPSLPFLFMSTAHMKRVLDGPIGDEILADMESHGFIGLCFYDTGFRSYGAKKPIKNAADMKGLKVRIQQSDV